VKVNILSALTVLVTAGIVTGCAPAQYMVNPPQAAAPTPESEQAGYMRILGDLRWDKLTSKEEWMKRLPQCLNDSRHIFYDGLKKTDDLHNYFPKGNVDIEIACRDFKVAGIPVNVREVSFSANSGTKSGRMTESVRFTFFDDSQSRALRKALAQKYALQTMGHCSKYTCYVIGDSKQPGMIEAIPTPYTVSLLDKVQLNKSDL